MTVMSSEAREAIDRARRLAGEERYEEGAEIMREAVRAHPDDAQALLNASTSALQVEAVDEAKGYTRRAAELAWEDPGLLTWAATQIFQLGEPEAAGKWAQRAGELATEDFVFLPQLLHLTAKLMLEKDDDERAEQLLRKAFELEPEGQDIGSDLAIFLIERARIEEALDVISVGLEHRPDDAVLLQLRPQLEELLAGAEPQEPNDGCAAEE
jgi:Flp pilus assembly protein TadD